MTCYSFEPRDRIFLSYGFPSFAKNTYQNVSKHLSCKCKPGMLAPHQKLLDHAEQFTTDAFKTASKKQFKEQQKQLVIWLVIKLLLKVQRIYHRIM